MNSPRYFLFSIFPLLRGGDAAPYKVKCLATLIRARRGRSDTLSQQAANLPRPAEFNVALQFLDRRGHPSSKEGKMFGDWILHVPPAAPAASHFVATHLKN